MVLFMTGPIVIGRDEIAWNVRQAVFLIVSLDLPNTGAHFLDAVFVDMTTTGVEDQELL